jgi:hypothetical protein
MKIQNSTDLDTEHLKALTMLLTKGLSRTLSSVRFRKCRREFSGACSYGAWFGRAHIVVRLGEGKFPFIMNQWHNKYYPRYEVKDKFELAIAILAHELYHLKAFHSSKRLKNTQIRAERFAMKTLQKIRTTFLEGV